jgi:PAS domain S-box-containing protein
MKLQNIHRYWEKVINTMNDGLILVDVDGSIIEVNRAFEQLLGYSKNEIIGKPCTILKCDACEIMLKDGGKWWCRLFDIGEDVKKHCVLARKDGTYLPVIKNASIIRGDRGTLLGAVETITDNSEIEKLDQKISRLAEQLNSKNGFHGILGKSHAMQRVFEVIQNSAQSEAPAIITGESGTGKELVANAIHKLSKRKKGPYVKLNCAALNESLLESELFGHVKGAFTGALRHRIGRFEAAHGGDIFLDEIGDIPLSVQVKLLRVLETKQFERVGDHQPVSVDVRIIAATNKDLEELISLKKFRSDLFFRINVIPIHLPPLRDRLEDIPLLINSFIMELRNKTGKPIGGLTQKAMAICMSHHWPGNVRELKSALEYAFITAKGDTIDIEHLPFTLRSKGNFDTNQYVNHAVGNESEKISLIKALQQSEGNQSKAAKILGISRVTVWHRLKKYGIDLKKITIFA